MTAAPARYAGADHGAIDGRHPLLDNDKNALPPGMDELLDLMDERGVTFAPIRARCGPSSTCSRSPRHDGHQENSGIVCAASDLGRRRPTVREVIRLVARPVEVQQDRRRPGMAASNSPTRRALPDDLFVGRRLLPPQCVDDQIVIDAIEAGASDDMIVKLAVYAIGPVGALAEATLAHFADTPPARDFGANWARPAWRRQGGALCATCSVYLGVDRSQTGLRWRSDLSMMSEAMPRWPNASQDVSGPRARRAITKGRVAPGAARSPRVTHLAMSPLR